MKKGRSGGVPVPDVPAKSQGSVQVVGSRFQIACFRMQQTDKMERATFPSFVTYLAVKLERPLVQLQSGAGLLRPMMVCE